MMIFFGLSRSACDFALQTIKLLIVTSVSSCVGSADIGSLTRSSLKLIPITMKTVLSRFKYILSDHRTLYATCPNCSSIHPPLQTHGVVAYPNICTYQATRNGKICETLLTEKGKPLRP